MGRIFRIGVIWEAKWSRRWLRYRTKMGGLKFLRWMQWEGWLNTSGKQMFMEAGVDGRSLAGRLSRDWLPREIETAGWNCSVSMRRRKVWFIAGNGRRTQMSGRTG